jgi:hypothetical protein
VEVMINELFMRCSSSPTNGIEAGADGTYDVHSPVVLPDFSETCVAGHSGNVTANLV